MKKKFLSIALALLGAFAYAQNVPVVAVTPFTVKGDCVSASDAEMITDVFFIKLGNTRKITLVNRNMVKNVSDEQDFQNGKWSDNEQKTAEYGKALNADWIFDGYIQKKGNGILITVQLFNVSKFSWSGGDVLEAKNADEAYNKINQLVDGLINSIEGTTPNQAKIPANFVRVEGGTFRMGDPKDTNDENPMHTVTLQSFIMSKYEVTQKEWYEVMGTTISQQRDKANARRAWTQEIKGQGDNYPMYFVNWYEAVEYCNKRSLKEGLTPVYKGKEDNITCDWTANGYRLPTEAEWEYAARGGKSSPENYIYSGSNNVDAVAWYDRNNNDKRQPVGMKAANNLGLYDMSGNVWEWCWDWYGNYPSESQTDPRGPVSGTYRVARGGFGFIRLQIETISSTSRAGCHPSSGYNDGGFRLVRN